VFSLCFRVFEVTADSDCAWGGGAKYLAFHVVVKLPIPRVRVRVRYVQDVKRS
jgi:hypothetical protein